MNMTGYEKVNARRYTLVLLNIVLVLGAFYPIMSLEYGQLSLFDITGTIDLRRVWAKEENLREAYLFLIGLTGLLYFGGAALHLMKLLGLLGERRRNSRFLSLMFAEASLAGSIGVPLLWFLSINAKDRYAEAKEGVTAALVYPCIWALICVAIGVWMIILAAKLEPTKPVFESLTGTRTEDGIMDYAASGRQDNAVTLMEDTTSVYEKNNLRRWLVFAVGAFPMFGMLLRVIGGRTAWEVPGLLRYGYIANKSVLDRYDRLWVWLSVFAALVLFATALLHTMKMMGLFGDAYRNNKRMSENYFILQIVALIGLAACNYMVKVDFLGNPEVYAQFGFTGLTFEEKILLGWIEGRRSNIIMEYYDKANVWNYMKSLSCWYYLWLGLSIYGIFAAHKLVWTRPLIEGAPATEPEAPAEQESDEAEEVPTEQDGAESDASETE